MIHIESVDLREITAVILNQKSSGVFALKLDRCDLLFESDQRTEMIFNLISIFEKTQNEKFKIYLSNDISLK